MKLVKRPEDSLHDPIHGTPHHVDLLLILDNTSDDTHVVPEQVEQG